MDLVRWPVISQEEVVEGLRSERLPGPGRGQGLRIIISTSERMLSEMGSRGVTAAASPFSRFPLGCGE